MPQRDAAHLDDILRASGLILSFLEGIDQGAFRNDLKTQSAVIRQFEIVGEATKRVSPEFKTIHPGIPWRKMAGMRDILIHAYDTVDVDEVWLAASRDIPALIALLRQLPPTESTA
ncbi:MAG: DUF86 domain-containing protein [Sulfurimicrobium sp.]|nr:DUF86 domain-containing protein [Sulfurimicrobium sp.]